MVHMDRVHPESALTKSLPYSAAKVGWSDAWQMSDAFPHSLREITQVLFDFFEVGYQAATL